MIHFESNECLSDNLCVRCIVHVSVGIFRPQCGRARPTLWAFSVQHVGRCSPNSLVGQILPTCGQFLPAHIIDMGGQIWPTKPWCYISQNKHDSLLMHAGWCNLRKFRKLLSSLAIQGVSILRITLPNFFVGWFCPPSNLSVNRYFDPYFMELNLI